LTSAAFLASAVVIIQKFRRFSGNDDGTGIRC
jgi:hypothetical protein